MDEVLDFFIQEAREHLAGVESDLVKLEAGGLETDPERIHRIFRAVHSIKGAAGCLSLTDDREPLRKVTELSHRLEFVLVPLRDGVMALSEPITNALLQGIDVLSRSIDLLPDDSCEISAEVALLEGILSGKPEGPVPPPPEKPMTAGGDRLGEILVNQCMVNQDSVQDAILLQKQLRKSTPRTEANSMRVDPEKLNQLLNTIGELVIVQTYLLEITGQLSGESGKDLKGIVDWLERNTRLLQEQILGIRKVAVGPSLQSYYRVVRDLAHSLGKKAELTILGEEVEVDKTIVERLSDPLRHLLRNALDHGVEAPSERVKCGKRAAASVTLEVRQVGDSIVLELSDDGRGMDKERILAKARQNGLVGEESLTDDQVYSLVFQPGFSTAEQVTDLSGRGVGMDVVKKNLELLHGEVTVSTEPGKGTTFRMRIPSTLARTISHGMHIRLGEDSFVIPLDYTEECLDLGQALPEHLARGYFTLRGQRLPLVRLREGFRIEGNPPAEEQIVVVRYEGERLGLVVDQVLGNIQTVYKPLDNQLFSAASFAGATILGNGAIALIVEVPQLFENLKPTAV